MNTSFNPYLLCITIVLFAWTLTPAEPIPIRLVDDFDHHGKSMLLFEKGGVFNYTHTGDHIEPWLGAYRDEERGMVGQIVFPESRLSDGMRYGGWRLKKDRRYSHISFWIKSMSGEQVVQLHLESGLRR